MRLLLASPFLPPDFDGWLTKRTTIQQIFKEVDDLDWAEEFAIVRLNGITVPRARWAHVTVKPEAEGLLWICPVPQKGSLLPILASVALIALTAGIGTFGVPFLGAGFAAGTFEASAAAAGVGIVGQLAIRALTAPPSVAKGAGAAQRDLSQAGISQNAITLLETLPTLHGKMLVSPPVISPPYTTFDADELTVHAIVGIQGRCLIENILINGNDITLLESCLVESREGGPADAPLTLAPLTCLQQTEQTVLSQFRTAQESTKNDNLTDQMTPANSAPDYHPFKTDGTPDEIWLRFLFPNGIAETATGDFAETAMRIEIRKVGDAAWRNLPTVHLQDVNRGGSPLRLEIKLKFQTQPSGRHFSNSGNEYPVAELTNITQIGQTTEYQSDAYFQVPTPDYTGILPVMSAATTSGVTMSASSTNGAQAAWIAADGNRNTYWAPAANSLPAWHKTQLSGATVIRSYILQCISAAGADVDATAPTEWYVEGSNNNVDWTMLDDAPVSVRDFPVHMGVYQIGNPGSYLYYRFTFTNNNGAANEDLRLGFLKLFTHDAYGSELAPLTSAFAGDFAKHASGSDPRCIYGGITKNGAEFYLDPAQWLPGAYEVRVKRGIAFKRSDFDPSDYTLGGNAANSDFFDYRTLGGFYVIRLGQKNYRSDVTLEVFSTVSYDAPVDTTGIACIAVELRNTVIDSISAEMTRYASVYSAGAWTDTEVPTSNPATLYRQLLLGQCHPNPPPGEIINEDELAAWHERCATAGHECNFLQQGRSVAEVKAVIAYTGYASPRESNMLSVVEDYDRSGEAISQMLSPLNSKLLGVNIPLPELEHAIYAEFRDAADDWKIRRDIFYRDGFDGNTAVLFSTVTYDGFTAAAQVATRAAFDLKQVVARARTVRLEIGIEGYSLWRGKLVGHNDDVLDLKQGQGLITAVETSGGNVVSITIDNIYPFSLNQDELAAFAEGLDLANATGVAIRLNAGTSIVKTLTNVADGNVCNFTTPFPLSDLGVTLASEAIGLKAVFGQAGREYARMIVMGVEPQGIETRIVTLAAEAPELFA